ncbi:MAG TPA: diheme cytochrome c [Burkholderiales bacterium]|nr:diheme cytochrome c [Burkholderiales bacterium]
MDTTRRWILDITTWVIGVLAGMVLIAHEAMASGKLAAPPNERWQAECASCHIAYPPGLLPAQTWKRLMSQLDKHFGTDASLEPAAADEIGAYLERHASLGRRAPPAGSLRITESGWFLHEHDEVPPASWKLPAVKSAANCAACHTTAEQSDFRKRNIRIPR